MESGAAAILFIGRVEVQVLGRHVLRWDRHCLLGKWVVLLDSNLGGFFMLAAPLGDDACDDERD